MHGRPDEEQWLLQAIQTKNIRSATTLIELIQDKNFHKDEEKHCPSLDSFNDNDESFLFLSIKHNAKSIARQFFDLQKNDPNILLKENKNKQTLIWQAAQSKNLPLLKDLIIACDKLQGPADQPLWLQADDKGNTPLHAAVSANNKKITQYLLGLITARFSLPASKDDELFIPSTTSSKPILIAELNKTNIDGNTVLHLALQQKNWELAAILAKAGCDWIIPNDNNESSFDYFCQLSLETQNRLLSELEESCVGVKNNIKMHLLRDDKHQAVLLNILQEKVLNKEIKEKTYHDAASMVSLKDLILAQAVTNPNMYRSFLMENHDTLPHGVPFEIETQSSTAKTSTALTFKDQPLSNWEQISQDRHILNDLLKDIDAYVTDLKNNPRIPQCNKILGVVLPILGWLTYAGIESWCIVGQYYIVPNLPCKDRTAWNNRCRDRDVLEKEENFFVCGMAFGIIGFLLSTLNIFSYFFFINWETTIAEKEWSSLAKNLEEDVLNKLRELKRHQTPADNQQIINDLQAQFNGLHNHQARQEVIHAFEQIAEILKKVKLYLNLGYYRNGITLFKPMLEIDRSVNVDEQAVLLPRKHRGCQII
jgi:Ankyrin repeats (3 copies)/Ankyrin repeat